MGKSGNRYSGHKLSTAANRGSHTELCMAAGLKKTENAE